MYRNLAADRTADDFELSLDFRYEGTRDASPAAVSFGFSSWVDEVRYEWAVQWKSLGDGSTWTFWNGTQWVDLGVSHPISAGEWHRVELRGRITKDGMVRYSSFKVDHRTTAA